MKTDLVTLDRDHPGFRDPAYRARRNAIAQLAMDYVEGAPVPDVAYTEEEHLVWRTVWENLAPLHARDACAEFVAGAERLPLDRARIPQLADVNRRLAPLTGFRLVPVAGLVTPGTFMARLGRSEFLSTQYMRHHSAPLYTPEPDVVHELVGHALGLANPALAELNRWFGEAMATASPEKVEGMIRVYWYTLEFGLVREAGALKAVGAGLLSSFGELSRFREARLRPLELEVVARTDFDPTNYQATLFVAESFAALREALRAWLAK